MDEVLFTWAKAKVTDDFPLDYSREDTSVMIAGPMQIVVQILWFLEQLRQKTRNWIQKRIWVPLLTTSEDRQVQKVNPFRTDFKFQSWRGPNRCHFFLQRLQVAGKRDCENVINVPKISRPRRREQGMKRHRYSRHHQNQHEKLDRNKPTMFLEAFDRPSRKRQRKY